MGDSFQSYGSLDFGDSFLPYGALVFNDSLFTAGTLRFVVRSLFLVLSQKLTHLLRLVLFAALLVSAAPS